MRRQLPPDIFEKVAYLASLGRSHQDIVLQLGVSGATVTRMIDKALADGILRRLAPELKLDRKRKLEIARQLYGQDELLQKLSAISQRTMKHLEVLQVSSHETPLQTVSAAVAAYLLENTFRVAKFVALTWGASTRQIVHSIERAARMRKISSDRRVQFVQVCGDPQGAIENPSLRCSTLVAKLNAAINNSDSSPYTFSVSASIPGRFEGAQVKTIRDFIQEVGAYSKIFESKENGKQRLRFNVDVLLTSCGNGRATQDRWLTECAAVAGMDPNKLEQLTIGNIGGYWLPKEGLSPKDQSALERINQRWNGIVIEDIELIARNGGVVLLAVEAFKAETVFQLVERRLVSHLFISEPLATAMSAYIQSRQSRPARAVSVSAKAAGVS